MICVMYDGWDGFAGSGFGHRYGVNDAQGYSWHGKEIRQNRLRNRRLQRPAESRKKNAAWSANPERRGTAPIAAADGPARRSVEKGTQERDLLLEARDRPVRFPIKGGFLTPLDRGVHQLLESFLASDKPTRSTTSRCARIRATLSESEFP